MSEKIIDVPAKAAVYVDKASPGELLLNLKHHFVIVMPNGEVYNPRSGFTEKHAKAYAEKHGGIFLPKVFGVKTKSHEFRHYPLEDFLKAFEWTIPNMKDGELKELAMNPETFEKLRQEKKYIHKTVCLQEADEMGFRSGQRVFHGTILNEETGECAAAFGSKGENPYNIQMFLAFPGFGYRHFSFTAKKLVASISTFQDHPITDDEYVAVYQLFDEWKKKKEKEHENIAFVLQDISKDIYNHPIRVEMIQPAFDGDDNEYQRIPVWDTPDLVKLFREITDPLSYTFSELRKQKQEKKKADFEKTKGKVKELLSLEEIAAT
ncbi:hypothetical protein KY346_05405 [Candidatus Woesearchaeota archaeon]|nr:hypothetical protein [Candidatus Woesearchaeota archaeon]